MSFAHPETMKMTLSGPFFLAKTLRCQEFTSSPSLRTSRLCETGFPRHRPRRVAVIFRAESCVSCSSCHRRMRAGTYESKH